MTDLDPHKISKQIKDQISTIVGSKTYNAWFKNIYIKSLDNGVCVLVCNNNYHKEWLEVNSRNLISNKLKEITNLSYEVDIQVAPKSETKNNAYEYFNPDEYSSGLFQNNKVIENSGITNVTTQSVKITKPILTNLNPKYTFNSYIVGSSNQLAHAVAEAVVSSPGTIYNPLYIYGRTGVGKTHLIQAIGNSLLEANPHFKIRYIPTEGFMNEIVEAIRSNTTPQFRDTYRELDVLILDDIQFISRFKKTQDELFNTFNQLYQENKHIIMASDRQPHEIDNLPDRIQSRFEGGMLIDIHPPDFETRVAIIKSRALENNVAITAEVCEFLANQIFNNIRELEGAVNKVCIQIKFDPQPITTDLVAQMLKINAENKRRKIPPERILKAVNNIFDVSESDIKGKSRTQHIVRARHAFVYLYRDELEVSLKQIARFINRKDHTTILNSYSKAKGLIEKDTFYAQKIEACKSEIYGA